MFCDYHSKKTTTPMILGLSTLLLSITQPLTHTITQTPTTNNNSSGLNTVNRGDNIIPFSTLSNLSPNSPHPIKSQCFVYGYVSDDKPLGNLLIIKFKIDGSCNPTLELFTNVGRVLTVVPTFGDAVKLGYNALFFIYYNEKSFR
jgi:hypothetical protein